MFYKRDKEEDLKESEETRFENQVSRPGIEIWPDDDDAMWILRHSDPVRDVVCSTPEFGDSPFCGTGHH
jgi:hypothetical protein